MVGVQKIFGGKPLDHVGVVPGNGDMDQLDSHGTSSSPQHDGQGGRELDAKMDFDPPLTERYLLEFLPQAAREHPIDLCGCPKNGFSGNSRTSDAQSG